MSGGDIFDKTPIGVQEVGAPKDFLEQLHGLKLIARIGSVALTAFAAQAHTTNAVRSITPDQLFSSFRRAKDFMNISMVNAMGIKALVSYPN